MELIYKSSEYCEFELIGLIHQWEQQSQYKGKSALEICEANDIPITEFWSMYYDYKAIRKAK